MKKTIETSRLILRQMQDSDFADYYEYASNPEVMKYIREIEDKDSINENFNGYKDDWDGKQDHWMGAGVFLKSNNKLIGDLGFRYKCKDNQQIEIGYKFNNNYHGKGYGIEAISAFVELIVKDWPFHKLVAYCDPRNIASFKIMQKFGMQQEGHFKEHFRLGDEWQDELAFGVLRKNLKI